MDLGKAPAQGTLLLIVITAVITATTTLIVTRSGQWLLGQLSRPFLFVGDKLWAWIAPRNPFSIALSSYRKHVLRSSLSRIENPVGPVAHIPLEHGFAPLHLLSENQAEPIELFSYLRDEHRTIVLGGPGTGKTTLMKHLMLSVVRRCADHSLIDKIPVFVVLRDLASRRQSVVDAIGDAFAAYHFPGASRFVNFALNQGKMIVLLDGLDEVGASRAFVVEQIQRFCELDDQQNHKNRVIVTCRENSYRTQDLRGVMPNIVRVEPFTNDHMRLFLKGWPEYRGRVALTLYRELQNVPEIREACRSPLLLSILAGLYLETEHFAIPRSRDRFYMAAIDELLVQRPARRNIVQMFTRDEKLQVLQRVALNALESTRSGDDTEALPHDVILLHAKEVLQREFDANAFVTELVEINGIIKPTEERIYTFPHRTIQEYLVAREARRTRDVDVVLSRFGQRQDLFEVLLFYCGVVENVPMMERIITHFANAEEWQRAGECLLNMPEVLATDTVKRVVTALYERVTRAHAVTVAEIRTVEILAALSQRQQANFESARLFFSKTIDLLTTRSEGETSALESALSSDPEAAMKLIPGLLEHPSPEWQRTAVRLLRAVGEEDALDRLVLLLRDHEGPARTEAAFVISGMIKSHSGEIRQRANLLPERQDPAIWPLENQFPSRVALPIVELLKGSPATGNRAIDAGVRALLGKNEKSKAARRFLKQWRHVPRDAILAGIFVHAATFMRTVAVSVAGVILAGILVLWQTGIFTEKVFVWQLPFMVNAMTAKPFIDCRSAAESLVSEISRKYPPNAAGIARLLPWNWVVEPVIPTNSVPAFQRAKKLSQGGSVISPAAFTAEDAALLGRLSIQSNLEEELMARCEEVRRIGATFRRPYFIIPSQSAFSADRWSKLAFPAMVVGNLVLYIYWF